MPALEFFRLDQPCSNDTLLAQEEEEEQWSSFIELAKKICEFKKAINGCLQNFHHEKMVAIINSLTIEQKRYYSLVLIFTPLGLHSIIRTKLPRVLPKYSSMSIDVFL